MDKLNAINLFCRVIETQSFTQAAQLEQISLAMASKLIAQLEEHLNVRLLHRTTRKITPTEAGLLYYQRCLPILNELKDAENSVSNITSTLQGKITISLPMDFGSRFVAPYLGQFMTTYPNIQLNIEFSDRRVDVVAEGYDLVLRIGTLEDSSIVAKRIARSELVLIASPDYLAKQGTPENLEQLTEHTCLIYENHQQWQFTDGDQKVKIKPNVHVISNNGYALLQMTKAGQGIVNLPLFLAKEDINAGRLIEILPQYKQHSIDISVLYPHRRYLSPKVKVLIEFLSKLMQERQQYLMK
ncbi:LysR family transcriptional regulator [Actinobacillus pleuropneumoniae]|uniref:LysR family transcriptional regulator n=1 Tax=Actinobacillus pleuropneumoniae TaxID=715 RepID=A0A9Q4DHY9_ACTPL|nr:LysR family transcriptional regulator [Actinobacillus pleuropneumoniae]MCL7720447.1 LysR family transcriptional regulator [Actinobacillus pleuropneumoniae]MCL7728006.1 LysR family transcriptional regulator [Actinobacillus pleuropneumoniae]MCL7729642.1 LysR family transcriptional regulator [Actinobacillus pleuropneumoniae]MCY6367624.1 LysR family transcriptional regulator [Actinobacillus pleuropneumoniae]MCY6384492.1 LysR family transcriptional regulator [Actinobacillus pleuropneumoniae]